MPSVLLEQPVNNSRSIGFPRSEGPTPCLTPTTSPRPIAQNQTSRQSKNTNHKGRRFVTIVVGSLIAFVVVSLWNAFFHYQAYGNVEGTVVRLAASAPCTVQAIYANEGDLVQADQLLAELDAREMELQRSQLNRQLQMASFDFQVRLAELRTVNRQIESDQIDRQVRYHQLMGDAHLNMARLEDLSNIFQNNEKLLQANAVSKTEWLASKAAYEGHRAQLDDLTTAARALENTADQLADHAPLTPLLSAEQKRIQTFQSELAQLDEMLRQSREIRAPVAGRILKRFAQPGERLGTSGLVFELVETDSVEAVIYLPQSRATVLTVGEEISLIVKTLGTRQNFRVDRMAPEVVTPPVSLQSRYRAFTGLVRIYAKPAPTNGTMPIDLTSWIGSELLLPRYGYRVRQHREHGPVAHQANNLPIDIVE